MDCLHFSQNYNFHQTYTDGKKWHLNIMWNFSHLTKDNDSMSDIMSTIFHKKFSVALSISHKLLKMPHKCELHFYRLKNSAAFEAYV